MDASVSKDETAAFALRKAEPRDEKRVLSLMESAGMGLAQDWQDGTVAVDDTDNCIGYLRVQHTNKGHHVAPVAVYPAWQGKGVGRALMEHALKQFGSLKLVARGEVAGFYRALGYHEVPFEEISDELEEDCLHCADRAQCCPVAFALERKAIDGERSGD